jgi:hypothetical protein
MVEHRNEWKRVVNEHRDRFHAIQLQAAVRRNQALAAATRCRRVDLHAAT